MQNVRVRKAGVISASHVSTQADPLRAFIWSRVENACLGDNIFAVAVALCWCLLAVSATRNKHLQMSIIKLLPNRFEGFCQSKDRGQAHGLLAVRAATRFHELRPGVCR